MPRASLAEPGAWRLGFQADRASEAQRAERWTQGWSLALLIGCVLYILIGHNPYQHEVVLDADTGGAAISPVNRYIWLLLTGMTGPLLWRRRGQLLHAMRRQWLLLVVFGWFALTTLWALDPASADRRLFLTVLNLVCAIGLSLGFGDSRRLHRGLAITCAIMVAIDLGSWALFPKLSMTDLGLAAIHTQKNQLGAAMLFCELVLGPYVFTQTRLLGRAFWGAVFLGAFVLLAASLSKTSIAITFSAVVLTPLLMALLKRPLALSWGLLAGFALLVAGAILGWLAWCALTSTDPMSPFAGVTFSERTDLWAFIIGEIGKRPFGGAGFGSFWDIDPRLQPSLQGELWFGSAAIANEAHNGYLDILATTGTIGFAGAMVLLFRWIGRGLAGLRTALLHPPAEGGPAWPAAVMLALFPMLIFVHNFMESSYFTANQIFGALILLVGVEIDMRRRRSS